MKWNELVYSGQALTTITHDNIEEYNFMDSLRAAQCGANSTCESRRGLASKNEGERGGNHRTKN
jgi:hypothetical protein